VASTIAEARAEQGAVELFNQIAQIANALGGLKATVDRATGFKQILIDNASTVKAGTMLAEVSSQAELVWNATEPDLLAVLDVVCAMLPNPATPGQPHTRNSLLDTLRTP